MLEIQNWLHTYHILIFLNLIMYRVVLRYIYSLILITRQGYLQSNRVPKRVNVSALLLVRQVQTIKITKKIFSSVLHIALHCIVMREHHCIFQVLLFKNQIQVIQQEVTPLLFTIGMLHLPMSKKLKLFWQLHLFHLDGLT